MYVGEVLEVILSAFILIPMTYAAYFCTFVFWGAFFAQVLSPPSRTHGGLHSHYFTKQAYKTNIEVVKIKLSNILLFKQYLRMFGNIFYIVEIIKKYFAFQTNPRILCGFSKVNIFPYHIEIIRSP